MKNPVDSVENRIKGLLKENQYESIKEVHDDLEYAKQRMIQNAGRPRQQLKDQENIEFIQNIIQKHAQLVQLILDDSGYKNIDDAIKEKQLLGQRLRDLPPTALRARRQCECDIENINEILRIAGLPQLVEEENKDPSDPQPNPQPEPPNPGINKEPPQPQPKPEPPKEPIMPEPSFVHPESLFEREMEDASNHAKFLQNSPDSFEKSLKTLTHILYQKLNQKKTGNDVDQFINVHPSQYDQLINTHLDHIKKTFVQEVINNNDIMIKVNSLQYPNAGSEQQYQAILNCLKQIQPLTCKFSFQEFFSYIAEAEKVSNSLAICENDIIVLFLGTTGAGKSTSIHYICGSEMYETTNNGLKHIAFKNVLNDDLLKVKVSPFARSETRYIRPINIDMKKVGASIRQGITLIDTPGLFDLKNAEVDVSNQIGIVKALQKIKSIRPFIVFSYKRLGARGEGLKEILNFYAEMIADSDYIEYFNFFFSHVDKDVKIENLTAKIVDILDQLNSREKQNARLVRFLETIISRAEDNKIFIIDPLNREDFLEILKKMTKTKQIPKPSLVFQKVICEESNSKIIEQFDLHKKAIVSAFKKMNGDRVNYLLSELKQFCEIMDSNQNYKQQMNEILNILFQRIGKNYTEVVNMFKKQLQPGNKIGEQEVGTYLSNHQFLEGVDIVRQNFLTEIDGKPTFTYSYKDLEDEVERLIKNAFQELNFPDHTRLDHINLQDYLQKLEFLANSQIPKVDSLRVEVNKIIIDYIKTFQFSAKKILGQIMILDQEIINNSNQNQILQKGQRNSEEDNQLNKPFDKFALFLKELEKSEQITKSSSQQIEIRAQIDSIIKILKEKFSEMIRFSNIEEIQHINLQHANNISNLTDEQLNQQAQIQMNKQKVDSILKYYQFLENFIKSMTQHGLNQSLIEFLERKSSFFNDQIIFWYSVQEEKLKRKISQDRKYSAIKSIYQEIMLAKNLPALRGQAMRQNRIKMNLTKLVQEKSEEAKKYMKQIELIIEKKQPEEGKSKENQQLNFFTLVQLKDAIRTIKELYWTIEGGNEDIYNDLKEELEKNLQTLIDLIEENVQKNRDNSLNKNEIGETEQAFKQIAEIQSIAKIIELELQDIDIEKYKPEIENNLSNAERFFTNKGMSEEQQIKSKASDLLLKKSECKNFSSIYTYLNLLRSKDFIKKIDEIQAKKEEKFDQKSPKLQDRLNELIKKNDSFVQMHMEKVVQSQFDQQLLEMGKYLKEIEGCKVDDEGFYKNDDHEVKAAMYLNQYLVVPVDIIVNIFKMIRELKLNYHQLWNKLSQNEDYEENFRQQIMKFYKDVEMEIAMAGKNQVKITNGLKIINHLIPLDPYLNEQNEENKTYLFQSKYDYYFQTILKFNDEVVSQAQANIRDQRYDQIKQTLVTLQQLDGMQQKTNMKMILNQLQQKSNELSSFISKEIKFIVNDKKLNDEIAESINQKSAELMDILEKIGEKFLTQNVFQRCKEELSNVQSKMSGNVDKLLDHIQKQIKDKRFYEAHLSIKNFTKTARYLELLNQPSISSKGQAVSTKKDLIEEIQDLPSRLKLAIEVVFEEFNSIQSQADDSVLEEIIKKSPKEIIENIQKISDDDIKDIGDKIILKIGPIFFEKIQILFERVGKKVEKGKGSEILYKINSYFKMCGQLPTKLNESYQLIITLQKIREKYVTEQEEESKEIQEFIGKNSENIQDVYIRINRSVYSLNKACQMSFNDFYKKACQEAQQQLKQSIIDGFQSKLYQLWMFQSSGQVKSQLDFQSNKSYDDLAHAIDEVYSQIIKRFLSLFQNKQTDNLVLIEILDHKIKCDIQKISAFHQFFEKTDHFNCANEVITNAGQKLTEVIIFASYQIKQISIQFSNLLKNDDPQILAELFKIIVFMRNVKEAQLHLTQTEFNQILKSYKGYDKQQFVDFIDLSRDTNHANLCQKLADKYKTLFKIYNEPKFFQFDEPSIDIDIEIRKEYYENLVKYLSFVQQSLSAEKDLKDFKIDTQTIQNNWIKTISDFNNKLKVEATELLKNLMGQNQIVYIKRILDVLQLTQESFIFIVDNDFSTIIQEGITSMKTKSASIIADIDISNQKEKTVQKQGEKNPLAEKISDLVIKLQTISQNIKQVKVYAVKNINETLDYLQKQGKDQDIISEIAMILKRSPIGQKIIEEQEIFIQEARKFWATKIQNQGIDYVLQNLEKNGNEKLSQKEISVLKKQFIDFDELYTELVEDSIAPFSEIPKKQNELKVKLQILTETQKTQRIDIPARDILYQILAHLFAIWTLQDFYKNKFNNDQKEKIQQIQFILKPHPAQVISIFRIFGIGYDNVIGQDIDKLSKQKRDQLKEFVDKNTVFDNLVQIKTGEGKSITLAMVICVFAMWGFHVSCACYSDYLSKRDYKSFKHLFEFLNLQDNIFYGTFNQISENYINKDGDIRELTLSRILKDSPSMPKKEDRVKKRVIVIDEVDVFFSKEFFNASYCPVVKIQNVKISNLLDHVWETRIEEKSLASFLKLKESNQYKECAAIFKQEFLELFEESVKDCFWSARGFKHDYIVQNGRIGYKEMDQVSFTKSEGYKTIFAHYYHNKPPLDEDIKELVTQNNLDKCKCLEICCGQFSFAEIPMYSMLILGVTGTLQSLTESEKKIIQDIFQIRNFTYTPSVYGQSKLYWDQAEKHLRTLILSSQDEYHKTLTDQITTKLQANCKFRSVIVFFQTHDQLKKYKLTNHWQELKCDKQELTEIDNVMVELLSDDKQSKNQPNLSNQDKEDKITKATFQNTVTLATRSFGRGTDFICRDAIVEDNGGVHVILTFVPEMNSEFVQIQGRTARQGNKGSFQMILLESSLSDYGVYVDSEEFLAEKIDKLNYILFKRDQYMNRKNESDSKELSQTLTKDRHNESLNAKDILLKDHGSKQQELCQYFIKINRGPALNPIKTLILIDATGSMGSFLTATKNIITRMFERSGEIMEQKGYDPGLNMIQIACFKNYSSEDEIFQWSPWECKAEKLKNFMDTMKASGGMSGGEAVEVGLQHAVKEVQECSEQRGRKWLQVYLIGDARPSSNQEVDTRREQFGFSKRNPKYSQPAYWESEVHKLIASKVKISTFYLADSAKSSFEQIANLTGGKSEFLNLRQSQSEENLLGLFTPAILQLVGEANGKPDDGKEMGNAYLKRYTS